jgi:phosphoglycerate kinase
MEAFANGTRSGSQSLCCSHQKGAFTTVGGGDPVAAVNQLEEAGRGKYRFVSTRRRCHARIYLEGKELPGIKAITE